MTHCLDGSLAARDTECSNVTRLRLFSDLYSPDTCFESGESGIMSDDVAVVRFVRDERRSGRGHDCAVTGDESASDSRIVVMELWPIMRLEWLPDEPDDCPLLYD